MSFSKRSRRGISLLETAAVMAVMAVLAPMAVGLLYTLMEVEGASRRRIVEEVALSRLADQFRRDAHHAVGFAVLSTTDAAEEATWRFLFHDGRQAEYRVEAGAGRIEWIERSDDRVLRRKTFQLPPGVRVSIGQASWGGGETPLAKLRLTPASDSGRRASPRVRPVAIEAAIGLDHRFDP